MHDSTDLPFPERTAIRGDSATLFVSLELSRSTWVATSLAPGSNKMSKHTLVGGDGRKLLDLLARLKTRAEQRIAAPIKVIAIHEVGLDGFWIHRLLEANGVESHVVDPASISVPRRHRRAKPERRGLPSSLARARDAAAGAHSAHEPNSRTAVRPGDQQL